MIRKFGAIRDTHDHRDYGYSAYLPNGVPLHVDLRGWAGPIKDQKDEGSCTGHAYTSAREWISRKYENKEVILSPQFLYVEELLADGTFPNDVGSMPRTACKVLTAMGACEAALYPYVPGLLIMPTAEQMRNALQYKVGAYHRVDNLLGVQTALANGTPWPVTVGFTVYESFMSPEFARTGIMPIPQAGEKVQGGHEVLCLGYDVMSKMALIQNSWGTGWGQAGYFQMPFAVLTAPDTDLWVVHTGRPWN